MTLSTVILSIAALFHPGGSDGERRGPPPEAIEACDGAAMGDACSFSGRDGEAVRGVCWAPEDDKPLACRPDDAPPPPGDGER